MISNLLHLCVLAISLIHIPASTAHQQAAPGCRPIADVIFLLDGSDSISEQEFRQQIEFVRQFVQQSDVSPITIRVGLTVVSSTIGDEFPLSLNSSKENLIQVLDSISQPQEGSRTDIGLVEMEQLFSRHARRGVFRIGVILTDGRAKYTRATEGEARVVKDAGVFLIAVGVGRLIKFGELEKIASTKSNAFTLEPINMSTKYLAETVKFLGQESCTGHLLVNERGLNLPETLSLQDNKNVSGQTGTTFSGHLHPNERGLNLPETLSMQGNKNVPGQTGTAFSGHLHPNERGFNLPETLSLHGNKNVSGQTGTTFSGHLHVNERGLNAPETLSVQELLHVNVRGLNLPETLSLQDNKNVSGQTGTTFSSKAPVITSQPAIQITQPYLSLRGKSIPINGNSFGRVIGSNLVSDKITNNLMPVSNTFDVKMEPFVAMETLKSRIPASNLVGFNDKLQVDGLSIDLKSLGIFDMSQISSILPNSDTKQSLTRFTLPQVDFTPFPPRPVDPTAPVETTTSAPTDPVVNTTPRMSPSTVGVTRYQPDVIQYQEPHPTPRDTANMLINSLINNKDETNRLLQVMDALNGQAPGVLPSGEIIPEITPTKGVGIQFPGHTVSETLAFLQKKIKPARTVEEHLNPVFRMFDGTAPATGRTKAATIQPTPTTISPKESYMRTEKVAMKDQCSKGRFVGGVAYTSKPGSCVEFLQCSQVSEIFKVTVARCPFETFFDDQHSVCRYHEKHMCLTDPCSNSMMTSYDHPGNCRAHWGCVRGQSVPVCCPSGTSYVPGFGCARNVTCTDTCMDFGNLNIVTHASECKLLEMDADHHFYFELVAGMGWVVRMCAPGSKFDQILCKCKGANEVTVDGCKPELYMDFQSGLVDISGNNLAMGIYNVELDGGTAAFFGKSHLKLWRFSGMSFGQHVTISFRFRTSVTAKKGRLMHIVSNCCYACEGQPNPSLDIAIIPADKGGVAVFSTTTKEAGEIFLFVPFKDTFTGWNKLEYRYDGLKMKGTVNGQSAQKNIVGNIIGKSEPLLIGSCGMANAYDGFIDEFKFYMCNP